MLKAFLLLLALLLFSSFSLAVSFSTGPAITPDNATTQTSLACQFTPTGTGTLNANITWWYNNGSWNPHTLDDETINVTTGVQATSSSLSSINTAKNEQWLCQVTLYNESSSNHTNSSSLTIDNSPPVVTFPIANQTVYEDAVFSLLALASDPDGDSITGWLSFDLNKTLYGGIELFDIASNGQISFMRADEILVGNHTMFIGAMDNPFDVRGITINFEFIAVNDPPNLNNLDPMVYCEEASWCNFSLAGVDEENGSLIYASNISFINLNSSGYASFIPFWSDVGMHSIGVNATDSNSFSNTTFNLSITTINHLPNFTSNSSATSSGLQNQTAPFLFYVNASDIDVADEINFSVETTCGKNPWNITLLANGSGGQNASAMINASFASTPGFIPNDFVECRDITIVATDEKENSYRNFTLDIVNTNDPPEIHEFSDYSENKNRTNMSNVTSAKGLDFAFRVNASDVDNLTYAGDSWNFSLFGHNSSKFQIDLNYGLVTSLVKMDDTYIGNYSFLVIVTDLGGLSVNATMNISVTNNSAPVLRPFDNSSCTEDILCLKDIIADDGESNICNTPEFSLRYTPPSLDNGSIVYNSSDTINYTNAQVKALFVDYINSNTTSVAYKFNITPNDSSVGLYELNVSFFDLFFAESNDYLVFNITNVNDIPELDDDEHPDVADPIYLFPAVRDRLFEKYIYGIDGDLVYDLDVLSFSYNFSLPNNITSNFNLTKVSATSALLSFYPNVTHLGTHNVTFFINDDKGGSSNQTLSFRVYEPSIPPNITEIKPFSSAVNITTNSLDFVTTYPSPGTIYEDEGDSVDFQVVVTETDYFHVNITLDWYVDGVLKKNDSYLNGQTFVKSFNYFDAGTVNVTVIARDPLLSEDKYEWNVIVYDTNQQPIFINDLANMTAADNNSIGGPQTFIDFFRLATPSAIVFIDPDDDINSNLALDETETNTLTFEVNSSGGCEPYATFTFTGRNLFLVPIAVGTCYTNFIATDPDGLNVSSNIVQIDILSLDSGEDANTDIVIVKVRERVIVPYEEEVDVPEEFQLIIPGITTIYKNGTVVIPLKLKNSWDDALRTITLFANTSIDGLDPFFSRESIASMAINEEIKVNLTLTHYRLDAPFEINISAYIDSLDHTDVTTLYVNALEKGAEDSESVISRIGFARDLLSDNPECQELNELLDEAQRNADVGDPNALEIVNAVIRGCKYLINTENKPDPTNPESFLGKLGLYTNALIDIKALITVLLALTIGALAIGIFTKFHLKKI